MFRSGPSLTDRIREAIKPTPMKRRIQMATHRLRLQTSRLDQTISQIEHRLSPHRLIDQALERMRGGPAAFASNLGRTIRHHPVPAAFFAAGLGWLLLAERGDKAGSRPSLKKKKAGGRLSRPGTVQALVELTGIEPVTS